MRQWHAVGGIPLAAGLTAAYWTAMGVSHPLAKKVGTWPSVLGVTAAQRLGPHGCWPTGARLATGHQSAGRSAKARFMSRYQPSDFFG